VNVIKNSCFTMACKSAMVSYADHTPC